MGATLYANQRGRNELILNTYFAATSTFYYKAQYTCDGETYMSPSSSGRQVTAGSGSYFYSTTTGSSVSLGSSNSYYNNLNSGTAYSCSVVMWYSKYASSGFAQGGASDSNTYWTLPEPPISHTTYARDGNGIAFTVVMPSGAGYETFKVLGSSDGSNFIDITSSVTIANRRIFITPNDNGARWYRIITVSGNGEESTKNASSFGDNGYYEVYAAPYAGYSATVIYDANDGGDSSTANMPSSVEVTGDTSSVSFKLSSLIPTRTNCKFLYWGNKATDPTKIYQAGGTVTISLAEDGSNYTIEHTFYAIWEQTFYLTIKYDVNGGSGSIENTESTTTNSNQYGEHIITSSVPTRKNYTFLGWAYSDAASAPDYKTGESPVLYHGNYSTYGYTLYAVWAKETEGTVWLFYNGVWVQATPYIFDYGVWQQVSPNIFDYGTWKVSE